MGSVAYDDVETPSGRRERLLGGSSVYFAAAASLFTEVAIVGVVGEDFSSEDWATLDKRGVDLSGLQMERGKTFRWSGSYIKDINNAVTLDTRLNVFESFSPKLSPKHAAARHLFLGNIAPALQSSVLESMDGRQRVVACDTMNLWITESLPELKQVIKKADVALMNEAEAKQLTGINHLPSSAKAVLGLGAGSVVIKRGEYGAAFFSDSFSFAVPAYPLNEVVDPTGAGDSFAGGFLGFIAAEDNIEEETLRRAMIFGSVMASFNVESFGSERLMDIDEAAIEKRFREFADLTRFTPPEKGFAFRQQGQT